jgi:gas vesicle protein
MFDLLPKNRINCVFDESRTKSDQMEKCESFDSTEITILERNEKSEPSTNSISRQGEEVKGWQPKARNQEDYIHVIFLYL